MAESTPTPTPAPGGTPTPATPQPESVPELSRQAVPDHAQYERRLRKAVAEAERRFGRWGERRG